MQPLEFIAQNDVSTPNTCATIRANNSKQLLSMVVVVFLLVVGLLPPIVSVWASSRAERRLEERFNLARDTGHYLPPWQPRDPDEHYVDGLGLVIGDITCQLNARSPHVRCAVNPVGPCDGCRFYEGRRYHPISDMDRKIIAELGDDSIV